MGTLTDDPGHGWTKIESASKKAYGCGERRQEAVEGLALYVRLGDGPLLTSTLAIRMTHKALRRFDAELELGARKGMLPRRMTATGVVHMAEEQDLTVIIYLLFQRCFRRDLACYYLVYDGTTTSARRSP
ncbi:hypothetical protein BAE44_0019485 [Dichanthelium oligosanthes]|uniref:Uncharacterized protein n=1 Tax=Dichanthelium oligosanthes TaxID=888268 RepID=A0A1E5V3C1_9POAL|nr:hypothetical protein BAE44_0019485 [Dichanthelium oligosanthes]